MRQGFEFHMQAAALCRLIIDLDYIGFYDGRKTFIYHIHYLHVKKKCVCVLYFWAVGKQQRVFGQSIRVFGAQFCPLKTCGKCPTYAGATKCIHIYLYNHYIYIYIMYIWSWLYLQDSGTQKYRCFTCTNNALILCIESKWDQSQIRNRTQVVLDFPAVHVWLRGRWRWCIRWR